MATIVFVALSAVVIVAVVQLVQLGDDETDRAGTGARVRPAPSTTTTTEPPPVVYQVQRGDTLTGIAAQFGVTVAMISAANQLANQDLLTEGQTLVIPRRPAVELVVVPATTRGGQVVELRLTGAQPGERITFEVTSPVGTFAGQPRAAAADGTVTGTYRPELTAAAGAYSVTATGDGGTTASAGFQVVPLG